MKRAAAALAGLVIGAALGAPAQAEPSAWAQASRPALRRGADAVAKADRLLSEYLYLRQHPTSFRRSLVLQRARKVLERGGAAESTDPEVRFRLGKVYYGLYDVERDAPMLERASEHFAFVARSNAPLTIRAEALNDLAICYARLGRHAEEIAAYGRALAIEPHSETRAVLLANRAEGFMVQGDISSAVRGYRASLRETPSALMHRVGVTTMWGLAVALDRSGDVEGALRQIALARGYDPIDERLRSDTWFFVPEYDDSWYTALGFWQRARAAEEGADRLEAYRAALAAWRAYIDRAPENDHWVTLAGLRLKQCEKELQAASHEAPRRSSTGDPEDL